MDSQVPVQESMQYDPTILPPLLPSQTAPQDTQIPPPLPLVASLLTKFRMPEIEQYTGIGCPRIHLRLYSTVMKAHGLDEAQMIICLMEGVGGLEALYGIEEGIARGLWPKSSPSNSKGKKPTIGQRSVGKLIERGLLTALAPRPPPQPMPPQFKMDLHYAYHQGLGHDTDRCFALRHAIQDLIDQGLVNLGQPSVTTNPLPAHTTHSVFLPIGGHKVSSILLDNGSTLNVCPLTTVVALDFAPSDFGPSTQIVRAYDNTQREVMGTLTIDFLIGLTTFSILFQVLRIPTSFNLLLGRPWIHQARAIPYFLHQKVKFIHDGQVITIYLANYFDRGSKVQSCVNEMGVEDTNLFSLCFPDETVDYGIVIELANMIDGLVPHDEYRDEMDMLGISQFFDTVQREPFSPLELFGVFFIEIAEEDQIVPALELPTFVVPTIDMYEGTVGPVEGVSEFMDPPL
ncbi:hypothetical protein AAG906_026296 [Vitis piasezkii]